VALGLAKYIPGKSLFKHFSGVVSASGRNLGYKRDLQLTLHPIDVDGKPSVVGFTIVVHVVIEYQSNGLLIGTQQQVLWGMETSCKTGLKTITAPEASGGTEFTFPFSVSTDGTSMVPEKVRSITPSGVEPDAPALPLAPATVHDDDPVPAVEDFFDCEELTEMAVAAIVTGEAGAIGCDWLKSTPDVSIAGTSEELDRLDALTEELLKAADVSDPGTDCKVKTVLRPKAAPLSNVRKRQLPPERNIITNTKNHVRRATDGVAGYALLWSLVWAAAIAAAVGGGVVPHAVHTFDHAAPLKVSSECTWRQLHGAPLGRGARHPT
jgi:hypothetical protein